MFSLKEMEPADYISRGLYK